MDPLAQLVGCLIDDLPESLDVVRRDPEADVLLVDSLDEPFGVELRRSFKFRHQNLLECLVEAKGGMRRE